MNLSRTVQQCCGCCLKALYWIPVVFVLAIVLWAYYVYVYVLHLSGDFHKPIAVSVLFLLIAHVILLLHLSSYFRTIFTRHKPIPSEYCLSDNQLDRLDEMVDGQSYLQELSANLPMHQVSRSGGVRYCATCEQFKPDRAHHCSTCHRCVLKMDHHCPWVNNCVGFSNYKYFVLFLFYTVLLCIWFCVSSLYDFIHIWRGDLDAKIPKKFNVTFCFAIVAVFSLSTSALLVFHLFLVCINSTTIENMDAPLTSRGKEKKLYYLGIRRNIQAVFGRNLLYALLPINTSEGNGASFPIKGQIPDASYRSLGSNHNNGSELVAVVSGSESEVEIFAVHDKSPETQPLAPSPALSHD